MFKIFSFFLIALLLSASFAQISTANESFRVLENESRLELAEKEAKVLLAVENPSDELSAKIKLEIVAPNDFVHAQTEISQNVGRGKQNLAIPIDISNAGLNKNELLWYRLRYEISSENGQTAKSGGIISFSQILPEVFELKAISSETFVEKMFRVRVQSLNPANQKAVADVQIEAEIKIEDVEGKLNAQAKTDAEGFAILEFKLPDFKMNAEVKLKIIGRKNGLTREVSDDLQQWAGKFAEIITDKPLYQPKQNVNLRLYTYNLNRLPLKDRDLTIEIENEESDETVFSEKVKTSRFGIAFASWEIPENAGLGNYQIYVKDEEDDEIALERIKITRYELPNFTVDAKPDRAFYLPNQTTAKVEINAKYLFGKVLPDAKVRIVSREREAEFFAETSGTLNDVGKFTAEIELSKAFEKFEPTNYRRFKDLKFSAYVTDPTTNRTEPRSFDIRITNEPIHVYLIGDTDNQSARLPLNFYVSTFYADGTPANCEVGIYQLINEDADGNEIKPEIGKSLAKLKTNKYGAGKLTLPLQLAEDEDEITVKLVATDAKGATGNLETDIYAENEDAIRLKTDKIAYRKGESVKVSIVSSRQKGNIFVDVVRDYEVIEAKQFNLENGRAELVLPYREEYKNTVKIAAYFTDEDDDFIVETKNIVFPTPTNLDIKAETKKEIYRPGENVKVKFRSRDGNRKFAETALGVLVIDKAVEERARIESETGDENSFLNRTFPSRLASFFGSGKVFGDMSVRDVKNLNLSKPLAPDLELAIEIALGIDGYRPQLMRTNAFRDDLDKLFTPLFRAKMQPVGEALAKIYQEKEIFPTDENSLREILKTKNIDFDELKDAWGNRFRTEFKIEKDVEKLSVWSLGADKLPDTSDDLIVFEDDWRYFRQTGKAIDKAAKDFTERTNGFITDYKTLQTEMLAQNINLDNLRDAWGNPYRFEFTIDRTNYVLNVKSDGKNGKPDNLIPYSSDDFTLWTNRADYFTVTKANLIKGFNEYVQKSKTFPKNEAEMSEILKASGFNLGEVKDVYGRPFYVEQKETAKLANFYRYENPNLKAVKQKITSFAVKSSGNDGIKGNYDDFGIADFSGATSEEEIEIESSYVSEGRKIIRQKTAVTPNGAIAGTVFDPNGAVIPNMPVKVRNISRSVDRSVVSNENGEFLIDNLPKDIYSLEIIGGYGFQSTHISNLSIEPGILIEIDVVLSVGSMTTTVEVSAGPAPALNTSSASIVSNSVVSLNPQINQGISPSFTPRVRDYFAETLVWSPELVTNKKGEAKLDFKMADSLTTWKLYAIGSDEKGDFGLVEKELKTFQPFFAELDPPKILTTGDKISLPVPIRNYTDKKQKVNVALAQNDWSKNLNNAAQNIEIAPNSTKNAIFDFEAISVINEGKQKVTALAKKEGDAIEKTVTVRPNGKEIVETQSTLFEKETAFDVNFPVESFTDSRQTELKIYPNMLAHVAESVEGLLKRPYGCGEQTTSSTYPNLLILKIEKELKKEIDPTLKAKANAYLSEGYKRLLSYQTPSGGFSYWGRTDTPNVALTAYILRFLNDADDFIEVDETVVENAQEWLLSQQKADGSWESGKGNQDVSTAYIVRALALNSKNNASVKVSLQNGVSFLRKRLPEIKDPFVLANLGLIADVLADRETVKSVVEKLETLSQPDKEAVFWTTNNTPFYGWGKPAAIETTALVVQFLIKSKVEGIDNLISRGTMFLLKNKDKFGVWFSTQTTVNVLDALILLQKESFNKTANQAENGGIFVNGKKVQEFSVDSNNLKNPFILDLSANLSQNENRVEIKGLSNLTMAQIVSRHYLRWESVKDEENRFYDFKVNFDKTEAKIGEEITCTVSLKQKNYRYGMLLSEIGIPPGADVDRRSLDQAKINGEFSSYDILPDRIVVYFWASSKGLDFSFKFKPRYGIIAQNAPSTVYDYYNEEAKATLEPLRFEVN